MTGTTHQLHPQAYREQHSDPSTSVAISKSSVEGKDDLIVKEIYEDADAVVGQKVPEKENFVEKAATKALDEARNKELPDGIDAVKFSKSIGNQ
jgi:hypothetical protein